MLNWQPKFRSSLVVLPVLVLATSCAGVKNLFSSGTDETVSFVQVDDLLTRVERVHVACELSGQSATESLATLMSMVGPGFRGDPTLAYSDLISSIELSEEQADDLQHNFEPMKKVAKLVFEDWQEDIDEFSSDVMRQHSDERLDAARKRYIAILTSVGPALEEYRTFNQTLRDHALYLGNDFNAGSVATIEKELRSLIQASEQLTASFEVCTEACQDYVRRAALRGQISPRTRGDV